MPVAIEKTFPPAFATGIRIASLFIALMLVSFNRGSRWCDCGPWRVLSHLPPPASG